ncbi:MAG: toll/interleukin-1 receptor domain-containing protein [Pseudomonadota bacterium]
MASARPSPTSIFISYSHEDARPRPRFTSSRMTELLADLRYELGADGTRRRFTVIKDDEGALRTGDWIDARLEDQIAGADIGLVFLSENYCRSESCAKELRSLIGQGKKLVLIELDDAWALSDDHLMTALRDDLAGLLAIRFWEEEGGARLRFGFPMPQTASGRSLEGYQQALQRLVKDIKAMARELRDDTPAATEPRPESDDSAVTIVLAASTSDTKAETDRLERVYRDAGYGIVRLDRSAETLTAQAIRAGLGRGDLFVQVIGAIPGRRVADYDDLPSSIAQHRIAGEAGIEVATWMAHDFDLAECGRDYADFLRGLATHQSSFEDFEAYSLKLADKKRKARDSERRQEKIKAQRPGVDPPLVSIDAAASDGALRDKIRDALTKHVHVDCIDDNASMEALSEAVQDNDAIILVYGEKVEGQKRAKAHFRFFRRWRRAVWNEENQRFEIAFGDAAPDTATPCPSGPGIHVIRIEDDIDPVSMQAFLSALGVDTADMAR